MGLKPPSCLGIRCTRTRYPCRGNPQGGACGPEGFHDFGGQLRGVSCYDRLGANHHAEGGGPIEDGLADLRGSCNNFPQGDTRAEGNVQLCGVIHVNTELCEHLPS